MRSTKIMIVDDETHTVIVVKKLLALLPISWLVQELTGLARGPHTLRIESRISQHDDFAGPRRSRQFADHVRGQLGDRTMRDALLFAVIPRVKRPV